MNHSFCIHSFVMGHMGCFQLLAISDKAIVNIVEHMPLWHGGPPFGYIPKNGIVGTSDLFISNFLRKLQIDFQSGCTGLQSHQQWRSVPLSLHPLQHVLSPEVLILAILFAVRWNLRVILMCISPITKDFEHFFKWFSVIGESSVVNSRFSHTHHFWTGMFGFLVVIFLDSLYILDISLYWMWS